jgi:hypothetical protein
MPLRIQVSVQAFKLVLDVLDVPSRRPKTAQRLAMRARIILKCATGMLNQEVARELRLDVHTVGKWREPKTCGRPEMSAQKRIPEQCATARKINEPDMNAQDRTLQIV